jgi:hypothetical protein
MYWILDVSNEVKQFSEIFNQKIIVRATVPKNIINKLYSGTVDTSIFRNGTLTVEKEMLPIFNNAIKSIKFY